MRTRSTDLPFASDMQEALLTERPRGPGWTLVLLLALLAAGLAWAGLSRVEEITQGEGRVVPSSREQIIQSLEGGILQEMRVREGPGRDGDRPISFAEISQTGMSCVGYATRDARVFRERLTHYVFVLFRSVDPKISCQD